MSDPKQESGLTNAWQWMSHRSGRTLWCALCEGEMLKNPWWTFNDFVGYIKEIMKKRKKFKSYCKISTWNGVALKFMKVEKLWSSVHRNNIWSQLCKGNINIHNYGKAAFPPPVGIATRVPRFTSRECLQTFNAENQYSKQNGTRHSPLLRHILRGWAKTVLHRVSCSKLQIEIRISDQTYESRTDLDQVTTSSGQRRDLNEFHCFAISM